LLDIDAIYHKRLENLCEQDIQSVPRDILIELSDMVLKFRAFTEELKEETDRLTAQTARLLADGSGCDLRPDMSDTVSY
jgi:hypothetical protein